MFHRFNLHWHRLLGKRHLSNCQGHYPSPGFFPMSTSLASHLRHDVRVREADAELYNGKALKYNNESGWMQIQVGFAKDHRAGCFYTGSASVRVCCVHF